MMALLDEADALLRYVVCRTCVLCVYACVRVSVVSYVCMCTMHALRTNFAHVEGAGVMMVLLEEADALLRCDRVLCIV